MAPQPRDGSVTVKKCLEELLKITGKYGIPQRLASAYPGIAAAINTLNAIMAVAKGLDDDPLTIDYGLPMGPEDQNLPGGSSEGPF